jgi:hypothetical protein
MSTQLQSPIHLERAPLQWFDKNGICHRSTLYKLRALGKIKFHYLLSTPWISFKELNDAMTDQPEGDLSTEKLLPK